MTKFPVFGVDVAEAKMQRGEMSNRERVSRWHLSPLCYVVKCWVLWNQILRWTLGYRTFVREQHSGKGREEVGLGRRRN